MFLINFTLEKVQNRVIREVMNIEAGVTSLYFSKILSLWKLLLQHFSRNVLAGGFIHDSPYLSEVLCTLRVKSKLVGGKCKT